MYKKIIFVDLENVQKIDDNIISNHTKIFIMVGKGQEKLGMDLLSEKFDKVDAMELIKVNGTGKNALDFFIAFYLGKYYNEMENSEIVICTKDGGYEPLKNHLLDKNINILRINNDLVKKDSKKKILKNTSDIEIKYNDVCEHFDPKNKHPRPRTLKTLNKYFEKDLKKSNYTKEEMEKIMNLMIEKGIIEVTDKQKDKIKWKI